MIVRPARDDDRDALRQLRDSPAAFERYLAVDGFLVIEADGAPIGFAVIYLDAGAGKSHVPKISDVHVGEAHRRRGAGTALIAACEARAAAAGHREIFVSVALGNVAMRRLLERRGYQALQREPYVKITPDGTYIRFDLRRAI